MINRQKLSAALEEYKKDFDSEWQDEKYKWQAVKCFQDNWDIDAGDFASMLAKSLEKTANLLASMNNFPKKMILQYAGEEAETVRAMFLRLYDESKEVTGRILRFDTIPRWYHQSSARTFLSCPCPSTLPSAFPR